MTKETVRAIALISLVALIVGFTVWVAGCNKMSAEDQKMMNDPEARAAKQKSVMQDAMKQRQHKQMPKGKAFPGKGR